MCLSHRAELCILRDTDEAESEVFRITQKLPQVLECACSQLFVVKEDANAIAATPKRRVPNASGHQPTSFFGTTHLFVISNCYQEIML